MGWLGVSALRDAKSRPRYATGSMQHRTQSGLASGRSRVRAVLIPRPITLRRRHIVIGVTDLLANLRGRTHGAVSPVILGSRSGLSRRSDDQRRTQNSQNCLSHCRSPKFYALGRETWASRESAHAKDITMLRVNYYRACHHEAASKFNGQKIFRLKIQQPWRLRPDRLIPNEFHLAWGPSGKDIRCE
jgi:hypothetical protein